MRTYIGIGGSYSKGRSVDLNSEEKINYYPITASPTAKYPAALVGTPGTGVYSNVTITGCVRNQMVVGDFLYSIVGTKLYRIDMQGSAVEMTGSLYFNSGFVYMEHDGRNLMLLEPGQAGYTLDTQNPANLLSPITDPDFPTASSLTWLDGYFIISKQDSGEIYTSALYDPTSWNLLDYKTAEGDPDDLVRVFKSDLNLWAFGRNTTEVFYNAGGQGMPFVRYGNLLIRGGCGAPASCASGENSLFWLTSDRIVKRATGFDPQIISTPDIDYAISEYTTVNDAQGFYYNQDGHGFYVLTFPAENATWCYDTTTGIWHQRRSYPVVGDGRRRRHRANCYAYFNGRHLVGDYASGDILELSLDLYTDSGNPIKRSWVTQATHNQRKKLFFHRVEVEMESGVGISTGEGHNITPNIMLSFSDDAGRTWRGERFREIGKIGQVRKRSIWNRIGASIDRRFKIEVTDNVKSTILGMFLDISSSRF